MENNENKNSGWPGFFQSNSPLAWFVVVAGTLLISYLVFKGATIEGCGVKITTMPEKQESSPETTKEKDQHENTKTADNVGPKKNVKKTKNEPVPSESPSEISSHDNIKFQTATLQGHIVDQYGQSAVRAKVTCLNCSESNAPCVSDESGNFQLKYKIGYKEFEYPLKKIELSIFYNNTTFSASQSISQNAIKIELK